MIVVDGDGDGMDVIDSAGGRDVITADIDYQLPQQVCRVTGSIFN